MRRRNKGGVLPAEIRSSAAHEGDETNPFKSGRRSLQRQYVAIDVHLRRLLIARKETSLARRSASCV